MVHLQVAGGSEVVNNLLWAELQNASVARLQQVTHHSGTVHHRHLGKMPKNAKDMKQLWRQRLQFRRNQCRNTWSLGDGLRRNWSRRYGEQAASTTLCPLNDWLLLATIVMSQNCWRDLSESMCFRVVSPWPGNRKHSVSIWNEEECEGGMKLSSKCKPESKRRIFPKNK